MKLGKKMALQAGLLSLVPMGGFLLYLGYRTRDLVLRPDLVAGAVAIALIFPAIVFVVQWLLAQREVVAPLKRIIDYASAIARDESRLGEEVGVREGEELAELAGALSRMSFRLAESREAISRQVGQQTRELEASEQRYRTLFEKMLDAFALHEMLFDEMGNPVDYRFLTVNGQFEEATGIPVAEVVGKRVKEILPNIEPFWLNTYGRVVATGVPMQFESYSRELDRYYEVKAFKVAANQFACVFRDISGSIAVEERTNALEERLMQAHKMEALGTLAGGIAHDFNNILAGILGYAELVEDELPSSSPSRQDVRSIVEAVLEAKQLVRQILDFSKKSLPQRVPLLLAPLLKETMLLMRATIPSTIEIREDIDTACGRISADPGQIRQVVMNLCTNAAQAMQGRAGTLEVALDRDEINGEQLEELPDLRPGVYAVLSVKDSGEGIPAGDLERLFDPYFTTREVGQGSGMGLSVVHGIVRNHDGAVTVASTVGEGSTFTVYFPAL